MKRVALPSQVKIAVLREIDARKQADRRADQGRHADQDRTAGNRVGQTAGGSGRRRHLGQQRQRQTADAVLQDRDQNPRSARTSRTTSRSATGTAPLCWRSLRRRTQPGVRRGPGTRGGLPEFGSASRRQLDWLRSLIDRLDKDLGPFLARESEQQNLRSRKHEEGDEEKDQTELYQRRGVQPGICLGEFIGQCRRNAVSRGEQRHAVEKIGVADDKSHRHGLAECATQTEHDAADHPGFRVRQNHAPPPRRSSRPSP